MKTAREHIEAAEACLAGLDSLMAEDGIALTTEDFDLTLHRAGIHATLALAIVQQASSMETVTLLADDREVATRVVQHHEETFTRYLPGERFETQSDTGAENEAVHLWEVGEDGLLKAVAPF